jgi:hypothetical protein
MSRNAILQRKSVLTIRKDHKAADRKISRKADFAPSPPLASSARAAKTQRFKIKAKLNRRDEATEIAIYYSSSVWCSVFVASWPT